MSPRSVPCSTACCITAICLNAVLGAGGPRPHPYHKEGWRFLMRGLCPRAPGGFDNSTWPTLILGLAHRKSLTLRRTVEAIDPPPFPLDGKVFENGPEPSRARK